MNTDEALQRADELRARYPDSGSQPDQAMYAMADEVRRLRAELESLQKQDPVAWQCRFHISDSWAECSREHHDLVKSAQTEFQDYEARALYAAPKPGEQQ